MASLYYPDTPYPEGMEKILEEMRGKCADNFGVTLVGNRLTLRWNRKCEKTGKDDLVQVHMIIEEVASDWLDDESRLYGTPK